jgi:uncharacterized membrane protein
MNGAHLHLLVNHFPIVGNVFSILFLVWALVRKNKELMLFALGFIVLVTITGYISDFTGDKAEDQVKELPGITKDSIEAHVHAADLSLNLLYATGAIALLSLILFKRNKKPAKIFIYLTLILALTTAFFLYRTGYLGGMIRHPEISKSTKE